MFGKYEISKQKSSRVILNGKTFRILIEKDKNGKKFILTAFDLRPLNKKGLKGMESEIDLEKLRKHNKMVDGVGFTMPPMYSKTLISKNKGTKKINSNKKGLKAPTQTTRSKKQFKTARQAWASLAKGTAHLIVEI